jgi:hypothetical protein
MREWLITRSRSGKRSAALAPAIEHGKGRDAGGAVFTKPARVTVDTYGHLDVADLRDAMDMLGEATGVKPDALQAEVIARSDSLAPGPTGVQALLEAKNEEPGSGGIPEESRALVVEAEHRVRTGDLRLGKASPSTLVTGRSC